MKKSIYLVIILLFILSGCTFKRIGSLTMVSTRNIDQTKNYVLLARNVEGISKMKHDDPLQEAIDEAVLSIPGGEYMMNAVVYYKDGKKMRVRGDVYGIGIDINTPIVVDTSKACPYLEGEMVVWKDDRNRSLLGRVNECRGNQVVIRYGSGYKKITTAPLHLVKKK